MHMRNRPERRFDVTTRYLEHYQFETQASEEGTPHGQPFRSDEPDPVGDNAGPATPALLATAAAHCLSASLLETSRKARMEITGIETQATAVVRPNADGNPRIHCIDVTLFPQLAIDNPRRQQCENVFQNYCTVSSSLKAAFPINVAVEWCIAKAEVAL